MLAGLLGMTPLGAAQVGAAQVGAARLSTEPSGAALHGPGAIAAGGAYPADTAAAGSTGSLPPAAGIQSNQLLGASGRGTFPANTSKVDGVTETRPVFGDQVRVDKSLGTEPRSVARVETSVAFSLIGVRIAGEPSHSHIRARFRADGTWGSWVEMTINPDHGEDGMPPSSSSEPFWVGSADAYEVEVDTDQAPRTSVITVRDLPGPIGAAPAQGRTSDSGMPAISARASWGALPPAHLPGRSNDVRFGVVHHSVSSNSYQRSEVPAILRSIQRYHLSQGWDDIGYNFAVDRFGGVWEARYGSLAAPVIGAHAVGFNSGAVGVVMLGEYGAALPTDSATRAVGDVIGWRLATFGADPRGSTTEISGESSKYPDGQVVTIPRVVGHRDLGLTSCPGSNLYARLSTIRTIAATRFDNVVARYRNSATGDFNADGRSDVLWWTARGVAEMLWTGNLDRTFSSLGSPAVGVEPAVMLEGDFNGDKRTDLLAYGEGTKPDGRWYAQSGGTLGASPVAVNGIYRPSSGDFDGNGTTDILWYGWGEKPDLIWFHEKGGSASSLPLSVKGEYSRVHGDFDGNGTDDIFWYGTGRDPDALWLNRTNRTHADVKINVDGTYMPYVGDFDGNGMDDILWYVIGSRPDSIWLMTGGGRYRSVGISVSGTYQPTIADFDGNGTDDIFWYAPGGTADFLWKFMTGGQPVSQPLTVNGTYIPTIGDFDGNGVSDLLWFGLGGASDTIWFGGGGSFTHRSLVVDGKPTPL